LALPLWDASALAKRYIPEVGTDTVDALFTLLPGTPMVSTTLGYAETFSTLLRNRNRGFLTPQEFTAAKTALRDEVLIDSRFALLTVGDLAIFGGLGLMEQYNINATDGAILALLLQYAAALPPGSPTCLLIAADQRLLAAARAEGVATLNPENVAAADVSALLASL
jgi:hypothetical protein